MKKIIEKQEKVLLIITAIIVCFILKIYLDYEEQMATQFFNIIQ